VSSLVVRTFPTPVATLVTIAGEVDITTVAELRGQLDAMPDRDTVVEISEVTLLSAAGMSVLLELQDRLATAGARLVLAAAPRCVRRVLTLTGLDARLLMAATVQDAVDSMASGEAEPSASIRAVMPVDSCRAAARSYPSLRKTGTGMPGSCAADAGSHNPGLDQASSASTNRPG
jgi:anti-anti-sigma factor